MEKTYYILNHKQDSTELLYSIRSLIATAPDTNVIVVGVAPEWFTGEVIETEQHHTKQYDITRKIVAASKHAQGAFVVASNDYIYQTKKSVTEQISSGSMIAPPNEMNQTYRGLVARDAQWLQERGYTTQFIASHAPLHTTTDAIEATLKVFDGGRVGFKSVVANMQGVDEAKLYNLKEPKLRGEVKSLDKLPFFSLNPSVPVWNYLEAKYPEPCRYEVAYEAPKPKPKRTKKAAK